MPQAGSASHYLTLTVTVEYCAVLAGELLRKYIRLTFSGIQLPQIDQLSGFEALFMQYSGKI